MVFWWSIRKPGSFNLLQSVVCYYVDENSMMKQEWIAAHYPDDIFQKQRLKTVLCLLYDKVVIHFPIAGEFCGGGIGISAEFSDDPLVEEGILDLREELLLDDIEGIESDEPSEYQSNLDKYVDLNVTGMALRCWQREGAVPVTDKADVPLPMSVLAQCDLKYAAGIQASALAIQSVSLFLPAFATLNSHDILEVREVLRDQLAPFRAAMFALAPKVRAGIDANAPLDQIYKEAKYITETDVIPRLAELKRRLAMERGAFWRKVIQKVGGHLPGIALKWVSGAGVSAAMDAAGIGSGIATQAIDNDILARNLLSNGGLGYLVNLEGEIEKRGLIKGDRCF